MGLFDRILGRKPARSEGRELRLPTDGRRAVRARYDAAQTTQDNLYHWVMADALSADAGHTPGVRRVLRNRARYERANNSYCQGMVLTLSNDTVGTGPTLKMATGDSQADRQIEDSWHAWADAIDFDHKLRTMVQARVVDGEVFGLLHTNPILPDVQLDLRVIETDQIASPQPWLLKEVDGMEFDTAGNVSKYHLLRRHPGSLYQLPSMEYDPIPAASMVHVFRANRPGQHRGVSELTAALPLFAQMRRYTLATIAAAETAADHAAVLFTTSPAQEVPDIEPFVPLNIQPRQFTALPEGWQLGQMKAEQPTTTYGAFKHEILNEIARCLNMPYNVAACNSSSYNYSSGRLDHQIYFKTLRVDRDVLRRNVLDRVLRAWFEEAMYVDGLIPRGLPEFRRWKWNWVWDGNEHIDPQAEATAQQIQLASNTTTLAAEFAKLGKDWEVELEQRALEVKRMAELGLTDALAAPTAAAPPAAGDQKPQKSRAA
jgi:lambda family phage portal protein